MVKLITEQTIARYNASSYQALNSSPVNNNAKPQVVAPVKDNDENKFSDKKKLVLPLGLIAGGGILLYFGLRKPSPAKLYDDFVKGKIFEMEKRMRSFSAFIKDTLGTTFEDASKFIDNFRAARFVEPGEDLGPLRNLKDPRKLLSTQDIAFEAIVDVNKAQFKLGAPDFGEFSCLMSKLGSSANEQIGREQRILKLELSDYVKLPNLRNEKYADLVELSENQLIDRVNFLSEQSGRIIQGHTSAVTKRLYSQMANAIIESRQRIRQAKMNVIETTFARMRQLLGIKDLKTTYNTIPDAVGFSELTPKELMPSALPKKLKKAAAENIYLNALMTKDFGRLSDKDIYEIFYRGHYGNDLQDLGFLIDKLRLKQAVDKAKAPDKKTAYDVIIPKLEYLSKRLHEFGKRELLELAGKDFDKMRLENKRATVYFMSRIYRRLGMDSIQEMDAALLKDSIAYKDFSVRKYITIFKDNPALYFC